MSEAKAAKAQRLAEALRANLRRRKDAASRLPAGRDAASAPPAPETQTADDER